MSGLVAIPFVEFCDDVLRIQLTPAQRVLCLVAIDGVDPGQLEGEQRELARQLFGNVDTIPKSARSVLAVVFGGRSGKTYIFGGLYSLWRALTADLSTLAPGELAIAVLVAPDLRLGRQGLRYALGAAKECEHISQLIETENKDSFTIRRPDDHVVSVECLPATSGGSALRGRSLVSAVLDEAAFFRDEGYSVNDGEIFNAVAPRVLPGGLVVLASTPWAETGLLYEEFTKNHGDPRSAIAAHAPTLLMLDTERNREAVARERERDPDNAAREFDAEFMPMGSGLFFDPSAIADCVDEHLPTVHPPNTRFPASTGGDLGFRSDSSAFVTVRKQFEFLVSAEITELRPQKGQPLVPSEVIAAGAAQVLRHGGSRLVTDHHYIESSREHLKRSRVMLIAAPGGIEGKIAVFTRAKSILHEGRLKIPAGQKRLIAQLREIVSKPTPGGGLTISSPRRGGAHGDVASAFVLALYDLERHGAMRPQPAFVSFDPLGGNWSRQI